MFKRRNCLCLTFTFRPVLPNSPFSPLSPGIPCIETRDDWKSCFHWSNYYTANRLLYHGTHWSSWGLLSFGTSCTLGDNRASVRHIKYGFPPNIILRSQWMCYLYKILPCLFYWNKLQISVPWSLGLQCFPWSQEDLVFPRKLQISEWMNEYLFYLTHVYFWSLPCCQACLVFQ